MYIQHCWHLQACFVQNGWRYTWALFGQKKNIRNKWANLFFCEIHYLYVSVKKKKKGNKKSIQPFAGRGSSGLKDLKPKKRGSSGEGLLPSGALQHAGLSPWALRAPHWCALLSGQIQQLLKAQIHLLAAWFTHALAMGKLAYITSQKVGLVGGTSLAAPRRAGGADGEKRLHWVMLSVSGLAGSRSPPAFPHWCPCGFHWSLDAWSWVVLMPLLMALPLSSNTCCVLACQGFVLTSGQWNPISSLLLILLIL